MGDIVKGVMSIPMGILGGLLGSGKSDPVIIPPTPAPPTPEAPPVMPIADDQAAKLAKRRSMAEQVARRGRASTILSQSNSGDQLGG